MKTIKRRKGAIAVTEKLDYKKEYKDLYLPPITPTIIDVPKMKFIMVDGIGNPNTSGEYKDALQMLYALSYSIKMSKMSKNQPKGYFEYVMPPLEGLWWTQDKGFDGIRIVDKELFCWTSMIRQPEFVTDEVFEYAKLAALKKNPLMKLEKARLVTFTEGLCVQIMHIGSFDDEPASVALMDRFVCENGYQNDISDLRRHHEIYLGDPRKTAPEKRRTVIRHPVVKK